MKSVILTSIFFVWIIAASFNPQNGDELKDVYCELTNLQAQINDLNEENIILKDSVKALYIIKPFSNGWYKEFIKNSNLRRIYGNSNILLRGSVNPYIHPQLFLALSDYKGPPITATSMYRPKSLGSLHQVGKAVDIQWNENAQIFIKWAENEGKDWLNKYGLEIHVENVVGKDKEIYHKYYRYIKWATGPHIHLEIKK